jgi:hypothetical protein
MVFSGPDRLVGAATASERCETRVGYAGMEISFDARMRVRPDVLTKREMKIVIYYMRC